MSSDVKIDVTPAEVRRMASTLRRLAQAFDDLDDDTEADAPVSVSGDERVKTQLLEFGENWSLRRDDMAEQMRSLAALAREAADAYPRIERTIQSGYEPDPYRGGPSAR
jgi:hypothetical protein